MIMTHFSYLILFSAPWLGGIEPVAVGGGGTLPNGCPSLEGIYAMCQPFPPPPGCDPNTDSCGKGKKCCAGLCQSYSCETGNVCLNGLFHGFVAIF